MWLIDAEALVERYPKYKQNYIRAFDRMLEMDEAKLGNWTDGEAVMDWWLGKKPKPKELEGQINIFEQEIMEDILRGE
jgi:phosphoadenosine phosphosulfate reductase